MRLVTAGFTAVGLLGGIAGAGVAFHHTSGETQVVSAASAGPTAAPTRTVVRMLDCRDGFHLKHGVCIRTVVRTVVDPVPVTTTTTTTTTAGSPAPARSHPGRHESRGEGEHRPASAGAASGSAAQPPSEGGHDDEDHGTEDHGTEDDHADDD